MLLLTCLMLISCGKSGALYLPEEAEAEQPSTASNEQVESSTPATEKAD